MPRRPATRAKVREAEPAAAPPQPGVDGPPAVVAVRDGVVESVHRAVVAVAEPSGRVVACVGAAAEPLYARSAIKPVQAAACLDVLAGGGASVDGTDAGDSGWAAGWTGELDAAALAIGSSSHAGTDDHQIEAARLLALADLDESALGCPAGEPAPGCPASGASPLAHNCSGKHALMLLATVGAGADPAGYLEVDTPVQQAVRRRLAAVAGDEPRGPGVDGCGAPAWRLSATSLAVLAARLGAVRADDDPALGAVAAAMRARPHLVGGEHAVDTALLRADARVVAKRGAEGVLLAADGEIGVVAKIVDGAGRATGPVVAAVLAAAGMAVPEQVRRPPVLGGGRARGALQLTDTLDPLLAAVSGR